MFFGSCFGGKGEKEARERGPRRLKLVVVGDGDCGKTCLLHRFTDNEFFTKYVPTVFEVETKLVYYKDTPVELVLFDTAGQEDYDRLRPFSYNDTDVAIICYAVDSPDSLANVQLNWLPELRYFCGNIPILLAATKRDLRDTRPSDLQAFHHTDPIQAAAGEDPDDDDDDDDAPTTRTIPVSKMIKYEQGLAVATKINAVGFYETSAKRGEGTDAVFEAVVRAGMDPKLKKSSPGSGLYRLLKKK